MCLLQAAIARRRYIYKYLVHRSIQRIQLGWDPGRGLGPGEGCGVMVVVGDVAVDRSLEVDDRAKAAALEPAAGERREEGLDGVQPGARGRREVEGPARITGQPGHDPGV